MKKILPFFLLVLLLASCQKDPDMSKLSDDFVVFTDHNKDANFESFTTFYIPDSVMVIGSSEKPEFWSATEADDIVSTLVSGMEGRGYTRASGYILIHLFPVLQKSLKSLNFHRTSQRMTMN